MTDRAFQASWPVPTKLLVLGPDEAHVWRVSLEGTHEREQAFYQTLSPDERQRADRFRFDSHRRRFVTARGVLRALLSRYVGVPPAALEFIYGPHGKPALARAPDRRAIFFNVSRSGDFALLAVTGVGEIGIDVEHARAISEWPEIAQRILAEDPDAVPPATIDEFIREWTRHEARVKATGLGLGNPATDGRKWSVHSLAIDQDLVAAIALPAGVRLFTSWSWCDELLGAKNPRPRLPLSPGAVNPVPRSLGWRNGGVSRSIAPRPGNHTFWWRADFNAVK